MARASLYVPDANTLRSYLLKATRAEEESKEAGAEKVR